MHAREKWLAFGTLVQGYIEVDEGCDGFDQKGRSLLASGITGIAGEFERGSVVGVKSPKGREIARGIVHYSAGEIRLIAGRKSSEIEHILGEKDYDEVIHRNNLWVADKWKSADQGVTRYGRKAENNLAATGKTGQKSFPPSGYRFHDGKKPGPSCHGRCPYGE